jgi:hypothetical protein
LPKEYWLIGSLSGTKALAAVVQSSRDRAKHGRNTKSSSTELKEMSNVLDKINENKQNSGTLMKNRYSICIVPRSTVAGKVRASLLTAVTDVIGCIQIHAFVSTKAVLVA